MAGRGRRQHGHHDRGGPAPVTLTTQGVELRRLRLRCQRLKRTADSLSTTTAWQTWSAAIDQLERLFEQIASMPPASLEDVAIRYQALASELLDGDLIVEQGARRRVASLGRQLRRLAGEQRA